MGVFQTIYDKLLKRFQENPILPVNREELFHDFEELKNASSSGGGVDGVTGNIVDNTDPVNPVVTQVQADWDETDNLLPSFIANKPSTIGDMLKSVYDPAGIEEQLVGKAIQLTLAQAQVKNDWIDGQLYLITDPISPLVRFYSYGTVDYVIPGVVEIPILSVIGIGVFDSGIVPTAVAEVGYNTGLNEILYVYDKLRSVRITRDGAGSTVQVTEQLRLSHRNCSFNNCNFTDTNACASDSFENIEADNLTLSCAANTDVCLLKNYKGSDDIIAFTATGQEIDGMNFASDRTISFAPTNGLSYTNCTVGGGKSITIQTSQNKAFIIDTLSTFTGSFDVDTLTLGDKYIDLSNIPYAGIITLYSSGGLNPLPLFIYIRNDSGEIYKRKFIADVVTANPSFADAGGTAIPPDKNIAFGSVLIGYSPAILDTADKFIELTYSPVADNYAVTELFV